MLFGDQHDRLLRLLVIAKDQYGNQIRRETNDTFIVGLVGVRDSTDQSTSEIVIPVYPAAKGPPDRGVYNSSYKTPNLQDSTSQIYPSQTDKYRQIAGTDWYFPQIYWNSQGPWKYTLSILVPSVERPLLLNEQLDVDRSLVSSGSTSVVSATSVTSWRAYDAALITVQPPNIPISTGSVAIDSNKLTNNDSPGQPWYPTKQIHNTRSSRRLSLWSSGL